MRDLDLAGVLVRDAGRTAAQMRAVGVTTDYKSSISDVVTEADRAAEELIVTRLAQERSRDGVLGEEGAARPSSSGRRWIIDPVDGTYNFVSGLTWWCSALALVEDDPETGAERVLLGAIYHPYEDALYLGTPGGGATRNGTAIAPLTDAPLSTSCLTTYLHPPDLGGPAGAAYARVAARAATQRMLGSGSLDMMAVATGKLGLFCQHSVKPWDRLPGLAIVSAVGGAARQVEAAGVTWTLIGTPTAVAEAESALRAG